MNPPPKPESPALPAAGSLAMGSSGAGGGGHGGVGVGLGLRGDDWGRLSDADLARVAAVPGRAGKEAFVEIVRRHQTAVCAVAWSVTGRAGLLDDVAQETFLKAWRRLPTLRDPAKLRAWLTRIAHDCAVDALQREKPHLSLDEPLPFPVPACAAAAPDKAAAEAEEEALVWSALAALPENLRTPLVLFYREGQSVAAVAAALDLSEEAVRQRLSRGRQALRTAVESRIETVLGRIQPSALLIATVAAGIGLLTKPAALAAGAIAGLGSAGASAAASASTAATAATGTTASITATATAAASLSTIMTATTWLAAAATLAAFFPLGWKAADAASDPTASKPPADFAALASLDDPFAAWPHSPLLAAWRRLHAEHGSGAAAMPVIYGMIQSEPDAFRRDALNVALLAEWAAVDPEGGFQKLWAETKNKDHAAQLMRAWLKRDPGAAASHLLANLTGAEPLAIVLASDIAVLAPDDFIPLLSALPEPVGDPRGGPPEVSPELVEAFSEFARRDLSVAVAGLPNLKGRLLRSARICVARQMAEKDPVAAMAWARALDFKEGGEPAVQAVIDIWAKSDPSGALASLDSSESAKSLADRVIAVIAENDLSGALKMWSGSPEKFGYSAGYAISSRLDRQFADDPMACIRLLEGLSDKLRTRLMESSPLEGESRYGRLSPEASEQVWQWLQKQPPAGLADNLANGMLIAQMGSDPAAGIRRLASLPEDWQVLLCTVKPTAWTPNMRQIRDSLGGGEFERMLGAVAPAARGPLLAAFFGKSQAGAMPDTALWRQRLDELPPEARESAAAGYTGSLTDTDPQLAAAFAESLPAGPVRQSAYTFMIDWWVTRDSHAASEWLNTLPPGGDRDAAISGLVSGLSFRDADAALTWAATITEDGRRLNALTDFVERAMGTDPDEVSRLLESPQISQADREALSRKKLKPAPSRP